VHDKLRIFFVMAKFKSGAAKDTILPSRRRGIGGGQKPDSKSSRLLFL
jgi:hypothetical protein